MIVIVTELVQERSGLQDEGWQHDSGQVHPWPDLLDQEPDDGLVLVGELFGLVDSCAEDFIGRV